MTIISSQHYIDWEIVDKKVDELKNSGAHKIIVPCSYVGEIEGVEYAMQNDRHHTMQAAKMLNLEIEFDVSDDFEGLSGETLLEARYMDGDWYNVETSDLENDVFDTIW